MLTDHDFGADIGASRYGILRRSIFTGTSISACRRSLKCRRKDRRKSAQDTVRPGQGRGGGLGPPLTYPTLVRRKIKPLPRRIGAIGSIELVDPNIRTEKER
jgi:hypothetical protein